MKEGGKERKEEVKSKHRQSAWVIGEIKTYQRRTEKHRKWWVWTQKVDEAHALEVAAVLGGLW